MFEPMLMIDVLRAELLGGHITPDDVVSEVLSRIAAYADPAVWISRVLEADLRARAGELAARRDEAASLPLYGIPFAVKDNIDAVGLDTTAACPAFSYRPSRDATVVARLLNAGAILIGKTNLDQFATGLVGTRSPYGAPRCVFDSSRVSGGSSSGSAVAVAAGLVSFALGTDTAGSGRVPAAFNNIVGVKPTRGLLSTRGVVPACRSLDCVSIFAASASDGALVTRVATGPDEEDAFSRVGAQHALPDRPRLGILAPADRVFDGDNEARDGYERAIDAASALGATVFQIDYAPFRETARLLYEGALVAERLAGIRDFVDSHADAMDPTVRRIIEGGRRFDAAALFVDQHKLVALRAQASRVFGDVDVLLLPTAPTIPTVASVSADPIGRNSLLGAYTNFVNLLDLAAIAVPAGFGPSGLPHGVTLIAPAFTDIALARLGGALHASLDATTGQARVPVGGEPCVALAVAGAHLSGMALNHELTSLGATFVRTARTSAGYGLYALRTSPPKPGLVRDAAAGVAGIEIEVWALSRSAFARFVDAIPAPLGIGRIRLEDGSDVAGFICEPAALKDAVDITSFGGWRAYQASK